MHMQHILIVGATSAIAQAFAREMVTKGASLFLVGRNWLRSWKRFCRIIQCRAAGAWPDRSAMVMDATTIRCTLQ